jgi:hypothetical protein
VSLGRYAAIVLGVVTGSLGLVWAASGLDAWSLTGAAFGAGLAAANTLLAYALVLWSARRSMNVFLGTVLGGMVGRMGLMLAAMVGAVLLLGLPRLPVAFSLLAYFVLFLVFELSILHRRTSSPAPVAR